MRVSDADERTLLVAELVARPMTGGEFVEYAGGEIAEHHERGTQTPLTSLGRDREPQNAQPRQLLIDCE